MSHTDCVCGQHAEIAAQRAEIKRMCEERDSAQRCIEKLTAHVAALEAVERAARSEITYMDETKAAHPDAVVEPTLNELRAALAALEVPRG